MENASTTINVVPTVTGFDELKANVEKLEKLSSEIEETIRQISETDITIELNLSMPEIQA